MTDQNAKDSRSCPVCGSPFYSHFADEKVDESKVNEFTYASRKQPEFMCLRLVRCSDCDLVYAPTPPDSSFLSEAYTDAAYDSSEEAQCAANSYAQALAPYIAQIAPGCAVDVGAGSGPLLPWLVGAGFEPVIGIEPSVAAISAATDDIRPLLRKGMFSPDLLVDVSPVLICSFMTLEHIDDPGGFVNSAYSQLEPGGMIAVVVHNWQGILNRILGMKSPIIDVEHLQLFNPKSVKKLLKKTGFEIVEVKAISNSYPLRYWLRLMPLSLRIKNIIENIMNVLHLSNLKVPMRVGNIMAIGIKPELDLK